MIKVIATGVEKKPGEMTFTLHYKGDDPTVDEGFELIRKRLIEKDE